MQDIVIPDIVVKRYILFAGDKYYPSGGWGDYRGSFSSVEEANAFMLNGETFDWWHIIDLKDGGTADWGFSGTYGK